jgi:hypothetical protein
MDPSLWEGQTYHRDQHKLTEASNGVYHPTAMFEYGLQTLLLSLTELKVPCYRSHIKAVAIRPLTVTMLFFVAGNVSNRQNVTAYLLE